MLSFVTAETSNIIYVDDDGGADFAKIQDAINAVNDGDTIFVYNGHYTEGIVVKKSITLIGEDKKLTIIDGQKIVQPIYVSASDVNLSGFCLTNGIQDDFSAGINVWGENVLITDCIIKNNDCGIRVSYTNNVTIDHCTIKDNYASSIYVSTSSNITIDNCDAYNNGNNHRSISGAVFISTYFEDKTQSNILIRNCNIYDNKFSGIVIGDAWKELGYKNVIIENNFISNHKSNGIYIYSSEVNINNNQITSNGEDAPFCGGIIISGAKGLVKIYKNQIEKNIRFGVLFVRSSKNLVKDNNFFDNAINAFFLFSNSSNLLNQWDSNYWDDLKIPHVKMIRGIHQAYFFIMFRNFDWHPAIEPYDIEVGV